MDPIFLNVKDHFSKMRVGLDQHYKSHSIQTYIDKLTGKGKFELWCDENEFAEDDIRSDFLDDDPTIADNSELIEFDDNFPLNQNVIDKNSEIFKIMKHCYLYGRPPSALPKMQSTFFDISNNELKIAKQMYVNQFPSVKSELDKDVSLLRLLALGIKHHFPVLLYVSDMYSRDKIKFQLNLLKNKTTITPSTDNQYSVHIWSKHNKFMNEIRKIKTKMITGLNTNVSVSTAPSNSNSNAIHITSKHLALPSVCVESAINSFYYRFCPLLRPIGNVHSINDHMEQIIHYIISASTFVNSIVNTQPTNLVTPFQFDFSIGLRGSIVKSDHRIIPQYDNVICDNDNDDNDKPMPVDLNALLDVTDTDDDDSPSDDSSSDDEKHPDVIGNVKNKLNAEKLIYCFRDINTVDTKEYDQFNANNVPSDKHTLYRLMNEMFNQDFMQKIKAKYTTLNTKNDISIYPRRKRFCCFIDRRTDFISNANGLDEIIFFEPPSNCNTMKNNAVFEWCLSSSRECIIPSIGYNNGKKDVKNVLPDVLSQDPTEKDNQTINSQSACDGTFITVSFHVLAVNEIRMYLYWNGCMMRFVPNDLVDLIPTLFASHVYNNKYFNPQSIKMELQRLNKSLKDDDFRRFYNKYGGLHTT